MINITIDIGNSKIVISSFKKEKMVKSFALNTNDLNKKLFLFYLKKIKFKQDQMNIIVSSVVPNATTLIETVLNKNKIKFYFLRDLVKYFNLKINLDNKKSIGDDRLVNAIYAKYLFGRSIVVIDFGTATTLDVLDKFGAYDGGIITPGIDLSLKSLNIGTAKLPLVKFKKSPKVVGKNTVEAIKSGFFWGYVSMIQGLIQKVECEQKNKFKIVITGGYANFFKETLTNTIKIDSDFNSKGLNFIMNYYLKNYYEIFKR